MCPSVVVSLACLQHDLCLLLCFLATALPLRGKRTVMSREYILDRVAI